jgi:ATP-dependent RNA helicase DeaD
VSTLQAVATFADLGLSPPVLEAITRLGYEQPTPIQEQAIPVLREGRDVIGQAQTGTGKTAAFGLPLLDYLDISEREVQALVLTPTRELCIQVTQALRAYGAALGAEIVAVFGGAPIRGQVAQLKQGGHVVVGTVGRVMDLMSRHELVLSSVRYVVLDEADEMLDLGFLEDVEKILSRAPSGRQTALFSATIPLEIKRLAESRMFDPVTIKVRAATLTIDTVNQYYVAVADRGKAEALARVLKEEGPDQAIVFVRTKIGVDRLARSLNDSGLRVKALHGDMSQGSRDGVMISFKDGRERVLVATDIAARGLDISGVTHVVNYDIPNSPDVYVHRIGRTGRVGRSGTAITLITDKQRHDLEAIEKHANTRIRPWGEPADGSPPAAPSQEAVVAVPVNGSGQDGAASPDESVDRTRRRRGRGVAARNGAPDVPPADDASPAARGGDADAAGHAEQAEGAAEAATPAPAARPDGTGAPETRPADESEPIETRRPRHTKPRRGEPATPLAKLILAAGRAHGLEPADVIGAIVDQSHLEGEDIQRVRTLERFSVVEVPRDRAQEVVDKVHGHRVRGMELRLEVLNR